MIATATLLGPQVGHGILGSSISIRRAIGLAERFATSGLPILLVGPTGSGKELFARAIHSWSRRAGPFLDINCGALPRDLVEGELFGHTRGAFTGAVAERGGLLAAASAGTLFLDELSSLPAEAQVKLLRVLENGHVRRLGETRERKVDFRLIAAAQADIHEQMESRAFRQDLYQRVAGLVISLPCLRARGEDVVELARHFTYSQGRILAVEAEPVLRDYPWPGNIRELRAAIDRGCHLAQGLSVTRSVLLEAIELGLVRENGSGVPRPGPTPDSQYLTKLCALHGWRASAIAAALHVSRATLFRMLRASGISLRKRGLEKSMALA